MPFLHAIPWLLVYNVVFVLPMLVISLAVYGGFAAIKDIEDWRQRNMRKLHLVAGVILGVIGVLIVSGIL
jgi:cytochrome c biogenesis protein CcdA